MSVTILSVAFILHIVIEALETETGGLNIINKYIQL